jgi:hypothetical protein
MPPGIRDPRNTGKRPNPGRRMGSGGVARTRLVGLPLPVSEPVLPLLVASVLLLASCDPGLTDPTASEPDPTESSVEDPTPDAVREIRMRVTGGMPSLDFTVVLNGLTGDFWGEDCQKGCSFQPGETLHSLRPQQVWYISSLFLVAGVHRMRELDFGPGCYGEPYVEVIYRYDGGEGSFYGCLTKTPQALQVAVNALRGLMDGRLPLVVDQTTRPQLWPQDPYAVEEASVVGGFLRAKVSYGGGCSRHEFHGVAWGEWAGSDPVQIGVFLSHDSFGDPCLSVITEERYFDLEPLKRAYQQRFGAASPGATILVIQLENHTGDGPPLQRLLDFRF